jgi:hypothetical protein
VASAGGGAWEYVLAGGGPWSGMCCRGEDAGMSARRPTRAHSAADAGQVRRG